MGEPQAPFAWKEVGPILFVAALCLSACGYEPPKPVGTPFTTRNRVVSIDEIPQHEECHGVKPRHCETIRTHWLLYYVAESGSGAPDDIDMTQPPLEWATPGHIILLTWQRFDWGRDKLLKFEAAL